EPEWRHLIPVHGHTVSDRLLVAFHPWKSNLEISPAWECVHVMTLRPRLGRASRIRLERNHLEGHTKDLGDFLGHQSVRTDFVRAPAQSSSDHLFTEELRHERPEPHDVRDGVAIPAFREHSDTHDATDVAAGRVQWGSTFGSKLLEPL